MKRQYPMMDVVKYGFALLVICAHVYTVFDHPYVNFFFVSILARMTVPFFFASSAFLVAKRRSQEGYVKRYVIGLVAVYLIFSLLYFPFGLKFAFAQFGMHWWVIPVTFVAGFFYAGTYYHLWYVPALIFAILLVEWLLKRMKLSTILILAIALYCFGAIETYYYIWPQSIFHSLFDAFVAVFYTTRNGLFLAFVFVVFGYVVAQKELKVPGWLVVLLFVLYAAECFWLMPQETLNFNFILGVLPVSFALFAWAVRFEPKNPWNTSRIRRLSGDYYFWHILLLEFVLWLNLGLSGVFTYMLVVLFTHVWSEAMFRFGWVDRSTTWLLTHIPTIK
ncbi:MAG: acyltransferase family protein [Erysipelotrichaceae bacterium]